MTSTLNQDQSDYWNGEVGQRWALYHEALDTAFALMSALIALVAGLLFGNLLVAPRRNI